MSLTNNKRRNLHFCSLSLSLSLKTRRRTRRTESEREIVSRGLSQTRATALLFLFFSQKHFSPRWGKREIKDGEEELFFLGPSFPPRARVPREQTSRDGAARERVEAQTGRRSIRRRRGRWESEAKSQQPEKLEILAKRREGEKEEKRRGGAVLPREAEERDEEREVE